MKQFQSIEKKKHPTRILQFGEGNFLRAFVDWMIDKANKKGILNHGVVIVQPIPQGQDIIQTFKRQNCMYHVYLEGIKDKQAVKEISLVECITDIINPYSQYSEYEELFLSEDLEMIISNTTEAGIRYEEGDALDLEPPKSFPAKITSLLYKRYKKFNADSSKGLLIICCELIEDNGSALLDYVLRHSEYNHLEDDFIRWIKEACRFYDTLVDRIVPGFPHENIQEIKEELGYDDNLVVKGEYYHVWAIGGDSVIKEKLPLDKAGLNVLYMDDIKPFRAKKVRILNGAHTAMVPIALQLGCETVKDAFDHPEVERYIRKMVAEEILVCIDEDPEELKVFADKILERFYNPYLKHYLKDISLNSLSKWETRNYPTAYDNYKKRACEAHLTMFSFAALLLLYSGHSEAKDFKPNDNFEFVEFIKNSYSKSDIRKWVSGVIQHEQMWKTNLWEIPTFGERVSFYVKSILEKGINLALKDVTNNREN